MTNNEMKINKILNFVISRTTLSNTSSLFDEVPANKKSYFKRMHRLIFYHLDEQSNDWENVKKFSHFHNGRNKKRETEEKELLYTLNSLKY